MNIEAQISSIRNNIKYIYVDSKNSVICVSNKNVYFFKYKNTFYDARLLNEKKANFKLNGEIFYIVTTRRMTIENCQKWAKKFEIPIFNMDDNAINE